MNTTTNTPTITNTSTKLYSDGAGEYNGIEVNDMGRRKQGRRSNGYGGVVLRGNVWFARFTDALGNRREVSTHTSSKEEALKVLATFTAPIRESHSQEEIKLRLQQSIDVLELRKDIKKAERIEVKDLVDKFINHRSLVDTTQGTKNNYTSFLKSLVKVINEKYPNIKYIDEVTKEVVEDVMGVLTKNYTPSSYNLALATYRRCWGMFCRSNCFEKITKRKIDKSRHRITVNEDDVRKIFDACRDDVERAIWGCGVYLGLRCGDVCSLTYGSLAKDLSCVVVTPMKTKKHQPDPLSIPICTSLKNLLIKVLDFTKIGNDEYNTTPLWGAYKDKYEKGKVSLWFRKTLRKAGFSTSHIDENGHTQVDTGFHITRHLFISLASKYMSPLLVQKLVGHSSLKMTSHYFHTNEDEMRKGLELMPDFGDKKTKIKTIDEQAIELLHSIKRKDESVLDCVKRLIDENMKIAC